MVVIGIAFMAISGAWFLTPLSEILFQSIDLSSELTTAEKAPGLVNNRGIWETLHLALDGLNTFIGITGLYLTLKWVQSNIGIQSNSSHSNT